MRDKPLCPACENAFLRPIIYGLVTDDELQEKADRGEIILAGCDESEDSPAWGCSDCGHRRNVNRSD